MNEKLETIYKMIEEAQEILDAARGELERIAEEPEVSYEQ